MKYYKIKVGIEEYSVDEVDIPRIAMAMQNNDIVKLESGLFRGQAILAVCRDTEREEREALSKPKELSSEEMKERERDLKIAQQKADCRLCEKGWIHINVGNEKIAKRCKCNFLADE